MASSNETVNQTDSDTGIKLEAEEGVIPPETVLDVKPVTKGANFSVVNIALQEKSVKFQAFDISLLLNGAEIQPNGKVKVTIPVPEDYNTSKLALYHIADNGTLTPISFTLDENKRNLMFETDHFSLYAIAQMTSQPDDSSGFPLGGIIAIIIGVLIAGGGAAAFILYRKHIEKIASEPKN